MGASPSTSTDSRSRQGSALLNGSRLLPSVDGRSQYARYVRELYGQLLGDRGGDEATTAAERQVLRDLAVVEAELAYLATEFAETRERGESPTAERLSLYTTMFTRSLRAHDALGLRRRPRRRVSAAEVVNRHREARS